MSEIDIQALLDRLPPDLREFATVLVMLADTFGEQKLTAVRIEAYHRNLCPDVSMYLFRLTADRMIQQIGSDNFRWTALPPVADIRKWAEIVRREEIPKHQIGACDACNSTRWKPVTIRGVERVEKCHCLTQHADKLAHLGLPMKALTALPVAREYDDTPAERQDYPTRDQLPEGVQDRFDQVRARQVLR